MKICGCGKEWTKMEASGREDTRSRIEGKKGKYYSDNFPVKFSGRRKRKRLKNR